MYQSIIRYFIAYGLAYLVGHGVITQAMADANEAAAVNYVLIGLGIVGTIIWSYLEKDYKGVLDNYFPPKGSSGSLPPSARLLLLVLAPAVVGMSLVGCSTTGNTFTYTPPGASTPVVITGFGAWCENNLAVIRSATKSTVTICANVFIKQGTTTTRIAGYVRAAESAIQPLLSQGNVSQADLESALGSVKVNDPSGIYADAISPAITLVGGYLVTLKNENVPTKVITDVLTALNNGLNDAALALDPTVS